MLYRNNSCYIIFAGECFGFAVTQAEAATAVPGPSTAVEAAIEVTGAGADDAAAFSVLAWPSVLAFFFFRSSPG